MPKFGVFSDEGCTDVFDSREEAEAKADEYKAEDDGYWADLIYVEEMCPDHEQQARSSCEDCFGEEDPA
ncbi:hypothetical protein [Streptodolium elevatio]|uniref:Uncharacterized protein n=1 Tax=Streptodolium elevatio TaxID=3157996 RepID=A0ABV3DDK0_9ACTN